MADWTLGRLEEACWHLRARGATDDTPVTLSPEGVRTEEVVVGPAVARPSRLAVWAFHALLLALVVPLVAWVWMHTVL